MINYAVMTPGTSVGDAPTVRLDVDNEPQPDAVLLIDAASGGQARISEDDYIEGAPELVIEIAASSVSIDLHAKKNAYRRNGVQEYLVWQVLDQKLDWFYLEKGEYLSLAADAEGILKSRVFPGLWLAVEDLLARNLQKVLSVVQEGVRCLHTLSLYKNLSITPRAIHRLVAITGLLSFLTQLCIQQLSGI